MRIIGGDFRGRKLRPIRGMTIRPTSDRIRESIFNILGGRVTDTVVLDLFAGTGALGIEALSRGARHAVFIDRFKGAISAIAENLKACGIEGRAEIFRWDVDRGLSCIREHQPPFTLVFLDPPYERDLLKTSLVRLRETGSLAPGARIVVEHSKDEPLPDVLAGSALQDRRRYGKTLVSFYEYGM